LPDAIDMAEWMGKSSKAIATAWGKQAENVSTTDITRRSQKGLVQMVTCAMHDVMKLHLGQTDDLVHADQPQCLQAMAGRWDAENAAKQIEMCYKIHRWIDASVNEKLIFEQLLLNCSNSDILSVF
ncbi:MAG: DNA polymerase III subunit delta' C-terminal domain-containing protein, partial [Planctomycetota bacterium]